MTKSIRILLWLSVAILGALALGTIALHRGEQINAMWLVIAAVCAYALGYRFYSKFISAKVLALDSQRATPAERLDDGRDFVPTNKWVVFGHHFAAIAGPGPLVGPVLAAQFGYLPGTLWILIGAVFGGCVQDFVILLFSVRRDGKSLTEMAREEIGIVGGFVAYVAVISIIVILLGAAALIVVNALKSSPWGVFTIAMTIPIALLMGLYLRRLRPGKVLEVSALGFVLVMLAILGGQWVSQNAAIAALVHTHRVHTCRCHHRLRIRCLGVARVVAARAPRLPEHFRQTGDDRIAGRGHHRAASHPAHAAADPVHRRIRTDLCRQHFPLRLHHHCLRRHQRIPFSDLQRHDSETDSPRARDSHGWLRRDDGGIDGGDYGDDCRLRASAGNLFRDQQPGGSGGPGA